MVGLMGTIYGLMIAFDAIANVPAVRGRHLLLVFQLLCQQRCGDCLLIPLLLHGIAGKSDK